MRGAGAGDVADRPLETAAGSDRSGYQASRQLLRRAAEDPDGRRAGAGRRLDRALALVSSALRARA